MQPRSYVVVLEVLDRIEVPTDPKMAKRVANLRREAVPA